MRFAWFQKNLASSASVKQGFNNPLTRMAFWAFNAAFWLFLLPFFTTVEYGTGFLVFSVIIFVRLGTNLYANNVLKMEEFGSFPFRIP